ncbi:hypothetical protein O6H91_02G045200 [Diphasiastrum complanatum]|uniref:Uncharacterized protein n=1 Tax=Diphasiastrum complanatum TaxID=34168 RepID=A0ACC2EF97_DIPCM|nr:hypothetical protein O6H91_02G045200 [Diphasiastrum complanatum]
MGEVEVEIWKPRNDKRSYRRAVLSNQLQVLLISDPDTDKAAASMDVHVGSFSDPEGLEGLAHFLEHMLFYSSQKYPLEESYSKYLVEHGGHANAYTSSEQTNFHFDVNADYLTEALDRFSQFFICPLFSPDATSREIKAVDSENSKNLTVDRWRLDQLARLLSSNNHPFHKFGTGNSQTLEIGPKSRGVDTRLELLKFYEAHYSSNLMCLAIYGKAQEKFSDVGNTGREPPSFLGEPCLREHLQVIIKAVPVKEGHFLELIWPSIPEIKLYEAAPSRYLGHLLGHEADGSLFALLKRLGWANSLSAGEKERSMGFSFFEISIELTDAGQEHMEDIVGLAFQYIDLLHKEGVQEWIFEEIRAVSDMKFHFQDKMTPVNYVMRLANNMQYYPVKDWLAGPLLPRYFDQEAIKKTLERLSPENLRIMWTSKKFEGRANLTEPWYGTAYSLEQIDANMLKRWGNPASEPRLQLPSQNAFIPTDFSLKHPNAEVQYPCLVKSSRMSRLWYKPDTVFKTPKACIIVAFSCPESNFSPEAAVLSSIFSKLLVDYLNEYAYYAEIAGLQYTIQQTLTGFQVSTGGYNHKQITLLEKILDKIVSFVVEEDRFLIIKEKIMKNYLNFKFQQPYQQVMYHCSLLLEHQRWHINDYLEVLPYLGAEDLTKFLPRILSRMSYEGFVSGNFTAQEAIVLAEKIERTLSEGPIVKTRAPFPSQIVQERILKLAPGANFFFPAAGLNPQDENSALQVYFQVGQDEAQMNVLLELFILTAKQEVFHQLRSVEQLGYVVVLMQRNDSGTRGAQFIIQSTVKDPQGIDQRVEVFLESFEAILQKLTDDEFKRNVNSLIDMKLEKHKNLWEETSFYWKEIDIGTLKFDRQEAEVAVLKTVEKQHLLDFYNQQFKCACSRRKLSIQVYGTAHIKELELALYNGKSTDKVDPVVLNARIETLSVKDTDQSTIYPALKQELTDNVVPPIESQETKQLPERIDNIFEFKGSQALFGSLKKAHHTELL